MSTIPVKAKHVLCLHVIKTRINNDIDSRLSRTRLVVANYGNFNNSKTDGLREVVSILEQLKFFRSFYSIIYFWFYLFYQKGFKKKKFEPISGVCQYSRIL